MPNRHKPIGNTDQTLQNRYEETQARLQKNEYAGYKDVSKWGCEFRKVLHENRSHENEHCSHPYVKNCPINISEDSYRGIIQASKAYYRVKENVHYVDVKCPYPYICNNGKFPLACPKVYVGKECSPDCLDREGIINCKVLPPGQLYHPVLPYKSNSKLMFPFCSVCADTMNQDPCTNSDEERCKVGTWLLE